MNSNEDFCKNVRGYLKTTDVSISTFFFIS